MPPWAHGSQIIQQTEKWKWYPTETEICHSNGSTIDKYEIVSKQRQSVDGSLYIIDTNHIPSTALPTIQTNLTNTPLWVCRSSLTNPHYEKIEAPPTTKLTLIQYVHQQYPGLKHIINTISEKAQPKKRRALTLASDGGRKYNNLTLGRVCAMSSTIIFKVHG